MTRDPKKQPKKTTKLRVKKETVKDLDPKQEATDVKGGQRNNCTVRFSGCIS